MEGFGYMSVAEAGQLALEGNDIKILCPVGGYGLYQPIVHVAFYLQTEPLSFALLADPAEVRRWQAGPEIHDEGDGMASNGIFCVLPPGIGVPHQRVTTADGPAPEIKEGVETCTTAELLTKREEGQGTETGARKAIRVFSSIPYGHTPRVSGGKGRRGWG